MRHLAKPGLRGFVAGRRLVAWCGEHSGGLLGWPANPADDAWLAEQIQCRGCRELAGLTRPAFEGPWRLTGDRWVRAISDGGRVDVVTVLLPDPRAGSRPGAGALAGVVSGGR